jgi:DNA polymerase (family 10)
MKLSKNMANLEIAELLRAIGASLELKDKVKNKFRIIAYQRAADAVEHSSSELKDLWDEGKLKDVPGIGESIASNLDEIFRTGSSKHFMDVMKGLPPAMFKLMELPGIGAKTGYRLTKELGIDSLNELEKAAQKGKIAKLPGFGHKSEIEILETVKQNKGKVRRHLLPYAQEIANEIIGWVKTEKSVKRIDPLGSLRRQASTVGDIDISVSTSDSKAVLERFVAYPKAVKVIEKGDKTSSILLPGNLQVDLMVQPEESYGSLLQHFTGSKHHNIALREYALKHDMSLSEYGIKQKGKTYKFSDEEIFYKKLGMEWIPPELREDTGEIEAALNKTLPDLVELKDIKGDLQIHSDFDIETSHDIGLSTMEEVVKKANELGYEYVAFTDHNPSQSGHNDKQIVDILKRKREKVDELNYSIQKSSTNGVRKVFNSLEIDILPEGRLPVPDEGLDTLDFALMSIHSSFRMKRNEMTKRILSAFTHPKVKIFAHPTGRKLGEREGAEINWNEVFEFVKKNNKFVEINADPMRLDLPDFLVKEAITSGILLSMGTDAHHIDSMDNMRYGISVARRGWATKKNIINTLDLKEFEKTLNLKSS